jgi:hypothetical protein
MKIGDKVRVIKFYDYTGRIEEEYIGLIGVVNHIYKNGNVDAITENDVFLCLRKNYGDQWEVISKEANK